MKKRNGCKGKQNKKKGKGKKRKGRGENRIWVDLGKFYQKFSSCICNILVVEEYVKKQA
jgi:hypothetical protein